MDHIERRTKAVGKSKTFKHIRNAFNLQSKSVLDIGCSYGEFLSYFGPGSTGVTLAPEEAAYGNSHGLDIRLGNVESDTFELERTYDVIFANNIFEHLYSPHHFLIRIKRFLKEDGVLILGVPSVPMITPLMRFKKFRGSLAVQHINFFTKETLRHTVLRAGWYIEDIRGFHFQSPRIDHLFDLAYPHFYAIARPEASFVYHEKRLKELLGYAEIIQDIPGSKRVAD